jgi:hypothetical protein
MSKTTIPTAGLADSAVTTAKITDANITTAKIADDAVTSAKAGFSAGKVLQMVNSHDANKASTTNTSFTKLHTSSSITPSATSSKILVMITTSAGNDVSAGGGSNANFRIIRTVSSSDTFVGSDPIYNRYGRGDGDDGYATDLFSYIIEDSPSTTSAVTYSIAGKKIDGSAEPFVGGRAEDTSYQYGTRFTLLEIGA